MRIKRERGERKRKKKRSSDREIKKVGEEKERERG